VSIYVHWIPSRPNPTVLNGELAALPEKASDVFMPVTIDATSASSLRMRVLHPESIMPKRCPSSIRAE